MRNQNHGGGRSFTALPTGRRPPCRPRRPWRPTPADRGPGDAAGPRSLARSSSRHGHAAHGYRTTSATTIGPAIPCRHELGGGLRMAVAASFPKNGLGPNVAANRPSCGAARNVRTCTCSLSARTWSGTRSCSGRFAFSVRARCTTASGASRRPASHRKDEQYALNVEGHAPEKAQEARRRAVKLRATQDRAKSDVERECLEAIYAYEWTLLKKHGKRQRASYTW